MAAHFPDGAQVHLHSDDFELFGLPRRFAQERAALDAHWKDLQRQAHPDRFAAQGPAAQRVAMQWSARINEAYQRLKDPLARAAYLCGLHGAPIRAEDNTAMPAEFLARQMQWREALDEAAGGPALDALEGQARAARDAALARLGALLDERQDWAGAAREVRALMFITRFERDIDQRREQLGQ